MENNINREEQSGGLGSNLRKNMPIIVLGEGRTGTSAVAGILNKLGVYMGEHLTPADETNPKGFWEDEEFRQLIIDIRNGIDRDKEFDLLVEKRRLLGKKWGFKVPMSAEILPYIEKKFNNPTLIRCTRNDQDALNSYYKCYSGETDHETLKKTYYKRKEELDKYLANRDHLTISLEEFLKDEESTRKKIADYIGLTDLLVSIIIPVIYRPDLAEVCIDSVIKYTKFPYELILVQEGEDKEVNKLLKSYDAKFVHNPKPKGFAGAMNSGLAVAEGTHYCFLNSDIVATPGWLTEMMKAFDDKDMGLVTPTFTEGTGQQSIELVNNPDIDIVEDPLSLKGVCFLISKEAIDKVGKWDEVNFTQGGGDDNDMAYRISKGGFKMAVARKSYIYHYNSASFREEFKHDVDFSKKHATKQFKIFQNKHGLNKDKPHITIAIPNFTGYIYHELALRLIQWSHDPEIQVAIKFYTFLAPLDNARNNAVKDFLETYSDYLCFIDDDIVPPPNALRELILQDKEIIAPLCYTLHPTNEGFPIPIPVAHRYNKDGKYECYYGKGVEETDTLTGGMHLVKREVYEKIDRPYFFTYHENGTVIYSEDFIFAQQCQKLGYKLYTHFGLPCKHIKQWDVKSMNDLLVFNQNNGSSSK